MRASFTSSTSRRVSRSSVGDVRTALTLRALLDEPIDWRYKGFPPSDGVTIGTVGTAGWNVLRGDLPLPALVLKESALEHNIALMAQWCAERGILHAPHGKTTMAPQLFNRQLDAGAWGITAATVSQARMYRAFGVERILLANELVEPGSLRWLADELAGAPELDFYCLVDSPHQVEAMSEALAGSARPVHVLVEIGFDGGRTGCRSVAEAVDLAAAVARAPGMELVGTEGYEGIIAPDRSDASLAAVDAFLQRLREATVEVERAGAFAGRDRIVVSAGGSAYFDRVVDVLGADWPFDKPVDLVIRSGGYVTHDVGLYERTSPLAQELRPALEAWGAVLSRPEPDRALVGLGKRDVSHDVDLPRPELVNGRDGLREATGMVVTALNDQHAYVRIPPGDPLAVGDLVGCGISHPCTAFDKWRLIPVVDDDYTVVDAVATFF
jgi:D-serine deaminase-like pyridoxal phosphate-dependent protein